MTSALSSRYCASSITYEKWIGVRWVRVGCLEWCVFERVSKGGVNKGGVLRVVCVRVGE
jgi:hypothetical protein